MKNVKKFLNLFGILLVVTTIYFLLATNSYAQYGQYGGPGPSLSILIDKMVGKPIDTTKGGSTDVEYVDNLSPSDPRFAPGQVVFFRLKVKNTSNTTLTNVTVKDVVPSYLEPVEGPGTYDASTRTITFAVGDFTADQEKVYILKMRVLAQDQLPADKGLFCLVNKAQAYDGGVSDEDTAQLCVEKQVLGVAKVPSAGPEMGLLLISGELLTLGFGVYLKKRFAK